MLNSGLAILAKNTIPEHTKRGVVAQVLFCESSQSVTTKPSIQKSETGCGMQFGLFVFPTQKSSGF